MRDNNEGKVRRGDKLQISAATWNSVIDSTKAHKRSRFNKPNAVNNYPPTDLILSNSQILVYNDTIVDLPTFAVLQLYDTVIDHAEDYVDNNRRICLTGVYPTDSTIPIGIIQTPLASGDIGKAVIAGATTVKVLMHSLTDTWANSIVGETGYLGSSPDTGQAKILWFGPTGDVGELADSIYLAIVLLNAGQGIENVQSHGLAGNVAGCLKLETVNVQGSSTAPMTIRMLSWDSTSEAWVGDGDFGLYGQIVFWLEGGRRRLSIGNIELYEVGFDKIKRLIFTGVEYDLTCDDYYTVAVSCSECAGPDSEFRMLTPPVEIPPGETYEVMIPVSGLFSYITPSQLQVDVETPEGIAQLQVNIVDPANTQFQIIDQPANTSPSAGLMMNPGGGPFIPNVSTPLFGQYQSVDYFSALAVNPNGFWQLQVINNGTLPIVLNQFQLTFGNPPVQAQFVVVNKVVDNLQLQIQPELLVPAYQFQVDWGDGNVEWLQFTVDPIPHVYTIAGVYDVIVRSYDKSGSFDEITLHTVISGIVPGANCAGSANPALATLYAGSAPTNTVDEQWYRWTGLNGTYSLTVTGMDGTNVLGHWSIGSSCGTLGTHNSMTDAMSPLMIVAPLTDIFLYVTSPSGVGGDYTFRLD